MRLVNFFTNLSNRTFLFACGIVLVAVFLGLWQWYDKLAREPDMDEADRDFFRRQDRRRWFGIGLMGLLAIAIFISEPSELSMTPTSLKALWQIGNLCVLIALIVALLVLSLFDWMGTRDFARRHRRDLAQEHTKLMLEVVRRAGSSDSIERVPEKQSNTPER
jgi:hypothetical protein